MLWIMSGTFKFQVFNPSHSLQICMNAFSTYHSYVWGPCTCAICPLQRCMYAWNPAPGLWNLTTAHGLFLDSWNNTWQRHVHPKMLLVDWPIIVEKSELYISDKLQIIIICCTSLEHQQPRFPAFQENKKIPDFPWWSLKIPW